MIFLILFAIFIATILLSIVLERIFESPILVSIVFLSIYLIIVTILFATGIITDFALGILIAIIFAIISYITAVIARFIRCICGNYLNKCCNRCLGNAEIVSNINEDNNIENNSNGKLLTISCRCNNGNSQDILSINSNCLESGENNDNCSICNRSNNLELDNDSMVNYRNIPNNQQMRRNVINRGYFRR